MQVFFVRDLDKFYGNTRREIEHLVEICGAGLFLFLWIATPLDFNQAWLTTSIVLCVIAIPATLFLKKRNEEIEDELAFSDFLFLFSSTLAKVYCYEELSSADIRAMEGVFKKLELTDEQVDFCINSFRKCENEDWDIDEILCDVESKFDIEVRKTLYELVWEVVSSTSNLSEGEIDTLKAMERMLYLPLGAYERCKHKFSSRGSDFKRQNNLFLSVDEVKRVNVLPVLILGIKETKTRWHRKIANCQHYHSPFPNFMDIALR